MASFKRKRTTKKIFRAKGRKGTTTKRFKRTSQMSFRAIAAKVNALTRTIETKSGVRQISDGIEYRHNNIQRVSSNFLDTSNGTGDVEHSTGQRIGDRITLSGVSFKMMLELNESYSDVTFRMMVVRSAKGDIPDTDTLWMGASGNKMLDTFNNERFTLLFHKYVKMTAPNQGNVAAGVQAINGKVTFPLVESFSHESDVRFVTEVIY